MPVLLWILPVSSKQIHDSLIYRCRYLLDLLDIVDVLSTLSSRWLLLRLRHGWPVPVRDHTLLLLAHDLRGLGRVHLVDTLDVGLAVLALSRTVGLAVIDQLVHSSHAFEG